MIRDAPAALMVAGGFMHAGGMGSIAAKTDRAGRRPWLPLLALVFPYELYLVAASPFLNTSLGHPVVDRKP